MTLIENSPLYKKDYGVWAGQPAGQKPDLTRCCEEVWTRERWSRRHQHHQCSKPRGHGPDGAYCKQHDPEVVNARRAAVEARSKEAWNKRLLEAYGKTFYDTLVKIAEGHNDARGLAQEAINRFKST